MLISGDIAVDNRGSVRFVNDFDFKGVKRFYVVENYGDDFRGWHGHRKESKWVYVTNGIALVGVAKLDTEEVQWFVMGEARPQILCIPAGYANGFKALEEGTRVMFFSDKTLAQSKKDDYRLPPERWRIP